MSADEPEGSLDDDLANAFDDQSDDWGNAKGEEDSEGNRPDEYGEEPPEGKDGSEEGEPNGGSEGSDSDVDLDALADQAFNEVEALQQLTGRVEPPAKRQRVTFAEQGSMPSGSAPASGAAAATADAAAAGAGAGCAHPVWVFGLCGLCGVSKEALEQQGDAYSRYLRPGGGAGGSGAGAGSSSGVVRLKHLHASAAVEISAGEAERIRRGTVTRLLSRKRLILILDLDHTLLNSTHLVEVGPEAAPKLAQWQAREQEANMGPRRLLYCLPEQKLWTKLRPGVFEFLEGLKDAYEMHIYTMGDKHYAAEVRRLLDPTGRLFSSVVAKDHSTQATSKHLDVLLSADELALVLDDTEVVWPGHKRNLLQIDRYHFFPSDLRKWGSDGKALLEQGRDESATDGALATQLRVLRQVHARFFSTDDPSLPPLQRRDVRDILAEQRRTVLPGCCILFSRCWSQDKDPRGEPLWQLAQALGATCTTEYDARSTTHVVAATGGTAKVYQARSAGKHVVLPAWLQGCAFRWKRLPESDFPVRDSPPDPKAGGAAQAQADGAGKDGAPGAGAALASAALSAEEQLKIALAAAGGGGGGGAGGGGGTGGGGAGGGAKS